MKFRFALALASLILTLGTSADRKSKSCSGCWRPATGAPTIDQTLGVNVHFTDAQPGEIKMIADAGFRWVRTDFSWRATEREKGRYDFSAYDRLLKSLEQYQIRALFILDYGNPLYDGGGPPRTDATRQAFANWAVAAARHFGNRAVVWEIYNEPNIEMFWPPQPNTDEYTMLAQVVARAFRARASQEKLVGPASARIDATFLESCFKANLLDYWSGVSVHPYRQIYPESAAAEYAQLRELISKYRGPNAVESETPIISGEWGYSSVWRGMDEEKQAAMVARTFLTNSANGIPVSIWYDWRDDGADPMEAEHHFGLVREVYRGGQSTPYEPKAAYLAAKTLSRVLNGYRFVERLAVGNDADYVLLFANDSDRRIVAWTTSATPHRVMLSNLRGAFSITKLTGESNGRAPASDAGIVIEISTAPIYLSPAK